MIRPTSWVAGSVLVIGSFWLGLGGCTPSPKNIPCENGGDCTKVDPKYTFCEVGRCVECVGDSSCPDKSLCTDGRCERHCKSDGDCAQGGSCSKGVCSGS